MPDYRRAYVPGGSFFFTLVTEGRAPILCRPPAPALLRLAFRASRARWPFSIDAFVLLPDHLHTIWTLPVGDTDYPRRWAWIKKEFAKAWVDSGGQTQGLGSSPRRDRRLGVWQRRYWEHALRDEIDFEKHSDYIHFNPVKHGLVDAPADWPFSSFHRAVRRGDYPAEWGDSRSPRPSFDEIAGTAME